MVLVMHARWLLSLLSLLLLANGCESPFPPRTLVERLRVLGIRADPADADITGSITLTGLVVDETGPGKPDCATWVVCPPGGDYSTSAVECWSDSSYPLPSGTCLQASGECFTQLSIFQLVAWFQQQLNNQGIDISATSLNLTQVDIWIGFTVIAGGEKVQAVKRLPVHFDESAPLNRNPVLTGLEVGGSQVGNDPIQLPAGAKITLKPLIDESSRETFIPAGETAAHQEDFVFGWFSNLGEFDYSRTVSAANSQGDKLDENQWSIPKTLPENQTAEGFLWLVVRDGRYGIDWQYFHTQFVP
jgi:hypothetical protein